MRGQLAEVPPTQPLTRAGDPLTAASSVQMKAYHVTCPAVTSLVVRQANPSLARRDAATRVPTLTKSGDSDALESPTSTTSRTGEAPADRLHFFVPRAPALSSGYARI